MPPSSQVRALLRQIDAIERAGLKDVRSLVDKFRQDVVLVLAEHGDTISPADLASLKVRFDSVAEQHTPQLLETLTENQRRLFVKGIQVVDRALESAQLTVALPFLSEETLHVAQDFGGELITGLTTYGRDQIVKQVQLGVMGQKPVADIIKAIGRNLRTPSVFATIQSRAETIFMTEVNRIANLASTERMKQAAERFKDLRKEWLHSHVGTPRLGHLALDGTVVDGDEKFELIGKDKVVYRIDGPHDPELPASETIRCRCRAIPVVGRFQEEEPQPGPPDDSPLGPGFTYGESEHIPRGFEQRIGERILPDGFWDQLPNPASFRVLTNSDTSKFRPGTNKITIGMRRSGLSSTGGAG